MFLLPTLRKTCPLVVPPVLHFYPDKNPLTLTVCLFLVFNSILFYSIRFCLLPWDELETVISHNFLIHFPSRSNAFHIDSIVCWFGCSLTGFWRLL